jgi:amidase
MWNVTGSPAISLPTDQTPGGLPVGVMLATAPGDEATLLALAAQIEQAEPWVVHTPPCW